MHRRHADGRFEPVEVVVAHRAAPAAHPAHPVGRGLQGRLAGGDAGHRRQRLRAEAVGRLLRQRAVGGLRRPPDERGGAFGQRRQLAEAEQHVLVAGQAADPRPLEHLGEGVVGQRGDVGTDRRVAAMQLLERRGGVVVVAALRLEVLLPAVAGDGHLHDLGGALVDRRDPHVALDLLDQVLVGVAVAAEGLDGGVGGGVAGLGRQVLGDRPLGVEADVDLVEALGGLLDVRPGRLQPHGVGHDQLVRVALLLRRAAPPPWIRSTE